MSILEEIRAISYKLPVEVSVDINKRIADWLASGGSEDHPYIEQQLRFAKKFINFYEESDE